MKISFALLCHNETDSLHELLSTLIVERPYKYEIVIIHDVDERPTIDLLNGYKECNLCHIYERPLNNNYAAQKNYMTEQCSGDYIVNPDADELFPEYILENIHLIIEQNNTELIWMPRINIVDGLTEEWAMKFGFRVNEQDYINYPDWQGRIYKNEYPRIHWKNSVHERLEGFDTYSFLPDDLDMAEHMAIIHRKTLDKQIKQNQKYDGIIKGN